MSQTIAVTVKGFTVTKCIDPKSKTEVPAKFKPKAVTALKSVQVDPPKGKTLTPYSADITVAITMTPKGLRADVRIDVNNQDPYSKKDAMVGSGTGMANVQTTNPDKGDTEAVVDAALQQAFKPAIEVVKTDARKP